MHVWPPYPWIQYPDLQWSAGPEFPSMTRYVIWSCSGGSPRPSEITCNLCGPWNPGGVERAFPTFIKTIKWPSWDLNQHLMRYIIVRCWFKSQLVHHWIEKQIRLQQIRPPCSTFILVASLAHISGKLYSKCTYQVGTLYSGFWLCRVYHWCPCSNLV